MRKNKQKDYKKFAANIYSFYKEERKMPSFENLKNIFNVSSKDTVFRIVKTMCDLGLVDKDDNGKILPVKNQFNLTRNNKNTTRKPEGLVKMLSTIEAGFPTHVEMSDLETITLDEWLLGDRRATFMLKVKGESMKDAGIYEGDFVIVERGKDPQNGDIVLAEVDGSWTLKFYRKTNNKISLVPANSKFPTIYPKESLEIPAVVVSIIRRFR